jgi:hypothetical protein
VRNAHNPSDHSDLPLLRPLAPQRPLPLVPPEPPKFDGAGVETRADAVRLTKQIAAVFDAIADGRWRTLKAIAFLAQCGEASASAQLRNLRKGRFGAHAIERKRSEKENGLYVYRLVKP